MSQASQGIAVRIEGGPNPAAVHLAGGEHGPQYQRAGKLELTGPHKSLWCCSGYLRLRRRTNAMRPKPPKTARSNVDGSGTWLRVTEVICQFGS